MAGNIHILDKNTINQIAAGEVIDRPASIIKELAENSIDAGASAISIEIKGGGTELIRITDNGSGINAEDIRVAFVRHSTSKIKDAGDLSFISSLGFRGEALASIAAVADVELITKTSDAFSAVRYRICGGEELGFEEIGAPNGTSFIIRDIFNNVPVRKKFLKSAATEGSYCNETVERIALSHPNISFKYINNGRTVIFTNGSGRLKDVIFGIYGRDIASETVEVKYPFTDNPGGKFADVNTKGIKVFGCICKPVVARNNRNTENYFVNGRFIRNSAVSKGIEDAYQPYLMQHKYPFTNLFIEIDPAMMDVNVHPTKQEVRFENPQLVYNAVFEACRDALSGRALIHRIANEEQVKKDIIQKPSAVPEPFENRRREQINQSQTKVQNQPVYNNQSAEKYTNISKADDKQMNGHQSEKTTAVIDTEPDGFLADNNKSDEKKPSADYTPSIEDGFKSLVEDADNYIKALNNNEQKHSETTEEKSTATESAVVETASDKGEYVQASLFENTHAESKDEFINVFKNGYRIVGQVFKTYWIVEAAGVMYMIDQHAAHEKIIYEKIMKRAENEEAASQLLSPPIICSLSATEAAVVEQYKDELEKNGFTVESFGGREYAISSVPFNSYNINPETLLFEIIDALSKEGRNGAVSGIKERIATCSCKAAVKGNTELSEAEARELIKQLLEADNPFNCPHGRPIIIDMTKSEIEKKFKRII